MGIRQKQLLYHDTTYQDKNETKPNPKNELNQSII